ncbi:MAG: ubiquinone anaerobic biosynthesis accessory factor UbiT [Cognaticolwellia sp.]
MFSELTSSLNRVSRKASLAQLPLSVRSSALTLLPKILKPSLRLVPFYLQKSLLISLLHSIFKEAIADDDFEFLTGKWLKISITDIDLHWWLSFENNQLIMATPQQAITEDVSFSASGDNLLLIAGRKQDPDTLFFQRRLKIEGDTELGLAVKNLIDAVEIDQLPSAVHTVINTLAELIEQTQQELKHTADKQ